MRRIIIVLLLSSTLCTGAFAQGKNNSLKDIPFKERIVTGGGLGLGFGSNQDFISVSPVIGYAITRKIIAGSGFTFRYTNYKFYNPSIKLIDYAVNPFVRYTIYRGIFVQTEFEYLNYEVPITAHESTRMNFNSFMAGGGVVQPVGDKAALYVMVLYNFSYRNPTTNTYTPYDSPLVIRAGINIGGFLGF
jgi:hypothetical protein